MAKRIVQTETKKDGATLNIAKAVQRDFAKVCKERPGVGRSMNDTASRLIQWFNRQPAFIRTAVTSDEDQGLELVYAAMLRRLADEMESKVIPGSGHGSTRGVGPHI